VPCPTCHVAAGERCLAISGAERFEPHLGPEDFILPLKVPQIITHEKVLVDCTAEFAELMETRDILVHKLGPMVIQFPFFDRWKFPKQTDFLAVPAPFLKKAFR
jgi:uncharacterized protein YecE (DUF72 family)